MNSAKLNVYRKVLQEIWEKFDGAEEFIRDRIQEICCNKKLSAEEVTYFAYKRLQQLLKLNYLSLLKIW